MTDASKNQRKKSLRPKVIMVATIVLASLLVATNALAAVLYKPDEISKGKLEEMAREYYENYFWAQIKDHSVMPDYYKGFQVSLGALLVYDEAKNAELSGYFTRFNCDIRDTYAKITPIEPYGAQDYEIELQYSCDF